MRTWSILIKSDLNGVYNLVEVTFYISDIKLRNIIHNRSAHCSQLRDSDPLGLLL